MTLANRSEIQYPEIGVSVRSGATRDTTQDRLSFSAGNSRHEVLPTLAHQPAGILTCSTLLGIKQNSRPDFSVVMLPEGSRAAGVFTRSLCPSVTIPRNRSLVKRNCVRALVVNSGNANVFTPTASDDLERVATLLGKEFSLLPEAFFISSTGVIGVPLPLPKFERGIPGLAKKLEPKRLEKLAEAMLTTDIGPKMASVQVGEMVVCGMAKGAGMIEPNMATMLAYLFTNVAAGSELQGFLDDAVSASFNRISVDGDTSTSDTVGLFSTETCQLSTPDKEAFRLALRAVCLKLARDVVSQGEGVTKILEVSVRSNLSDEVSNKLAKQIVNSPLVKSAVHGADPNWGRVVMALGKPIQGLHEQLIDPKELRISLQGIPVYERGDEIELDLKKLSSIMRSERVVAIDVALGRGTAIGRAWGCDLSSEYVRINSEYTT